MRTLVHGRRLRSGRRSLVVVCEKQVQCVFHRTAILHARDAASLLSLSLSLILIDAMKSVLSSLLLLAFLLASSLALQAEHRTALIDICVQNKPNVWAAMSNDFTNCTGMIDEWARTLDSSLEGIGAQYGMVNNLYELSRVLGNHLIVYYSNILILSI